VRRARLIGVTASAVGIAAIMGASYVAAGPAGLVDAAALAAVGILVVARGTMRREKAGSVRHLDLHLNRRNTDHAAGFPAYRKIASDLDWAQLSRRHYEYVTRPMLARLAAALGRPQAVAEELTGPPADGPGVDPATLEAIVSRLEGGSAP
jgi:hypothetical protein